ncbi:ABC-2 family transporter protein [Paenibacillus sp. y28]
MTLVSTLMYSVMFYSVWKAIYLYSETQTMPWQELVTYIMVGQAINFARWSPAERNMVYGTAERIRSGDIAVDLIRPLQFQTRRFLEATGFFAVEMLWVNLPVMALLLLVLNVSPPSGVAAGIGFAISLIIAFLVSFCLNSIVMMLSFWTGNAMGIQVAKRAIVDVFAGAFIPFAFFPDWLLPLVQHLPFQAMGYIPLSIYTGKIEGSAMLGVLIEQIGWALLMFVISRFMWRLASRRITVNGG